MSFAKDGALRIRAALDPSDLRRLEDAVANLPPDQAGVRLFGIPKLRPLLASSGAIGRVAASVLDESARPVRAILFDKTASTNWGLPWHQDRTIVVTRRVEVEGFGPWTVKSGLLHVAPPFDLLAGMVTLRVHLDPVPETNAPLLIARIASDGTNSRRRTEVGRSTMRDRHLPCRCRGRLALFDADPSLLGGCS